MILYFFGTEMKKRNSEKTMFLITNHNFPHIIGQTLNGYLKLLVFTTNIRIYYSTKLCSKP